MSGAKGRLAVVALGGLVAMLALAPAAPSDDTPPATQSTPTTQPRGKPAGPLRRGPQARARSYMGRPIADVMSYLGADWLFRPEREVEEQPERMLDALGIKEGWTVADVGAGAGYTSLRLARRVGPTGVVLASDVQPQMLQMLIRNAQRAQVENITPILCSQTYTGLPPNAVDLAIMVDVYHEMSDPAASLQGIRRALKPDGRLVLVEFRAEDPDVPIKPEHKMSVDQVRREIEPRGFRFKENLDFLPWQHIIIFEKSVDAPRR